MPVVEEAALMVAERPGEEALGPLIESVQGELAALARAALARERRGHTLETGALINEVFLRLSSQRNISWAERSEFLAAAAVTMRRVLVDHARGKRALKRGGDASPLPLDEALEVVESRAVDMVALDEGLDELAVVDARKAKVVELRFFAGLSVEEVAETLDVPKRTVERDWTMAKAWLRARLDRDGDA